MAPEKIFNKRIYMIFAKLHIKKDTNFTLVAIFVNRRLELHDFGTNRFILPRQIDWYQNHAIPINRLQDIEVAP